MKRRIVKPSHKNTKLVPEGKRKCPICGENMFIEKLKGVSIDICDKHGMWFDKGEFQEVTRKLRTKILSEKHAAIKKAKLDGKISGSLLGVWSFLLD